MDVTRREFLKTAGKMAGMGALAFLGFGGLYHLPLSERFKRLRKRLGGGFFSLEGKMLVTPPYQIGLVSPYNLETALLSYITYDKWKQNLPKCQLKFRDRDKIKIRKVEERKSGIFTIHYLHLTGLSPGSDYKFELTGSPFRGDVKTTHEKKDEFKFFVVSDTQNWDNSVFYNDRKADLLQSMLREKDDYSLDNPRLLINCGDVTQNSKMNEYVFNFFSVFHPLLLRTPFYSVKGNHDYRGKSFDDIFGYNLNVPGIPLIENENVNYSFDYGHVHFAVLDSNEDKEKARRFLEEDLKRSNARFNLVFFHHPFEIETNDLDMDGVIAGHLHTYRRYVRLAKNVIFFFPVLTGKLPIKNKVPYVIAGGSGSKLFREDLFWKPTVEGLTEVTKFHDYHYLSCQVSSQDIVFRATDIYGKVRDSFIIR